MASLNSPLLSTDSAAAAVAREPLFGPSATSANAGSARGLWFAKKKFRRIDGYCEIPRLIDILDAQFSSSKAIRQT